MRRSILRISLLATVSTLALTAASPLAAAPPGGSFKVTSLVSDVPGAATVTDPPLVSAWGLARGATSPWWVSDNGTELATLYNSAGAPASLVVDVAGGPTGAVFAGIAGSFPVATTASATLGPASFIFASEDGM